MLESFDILSRPDHELARAATKRVWGYLRSNEDPRGFKSFDVDSIKERGWLAVPVARFLAEDQVERLATLAREQGVGSSVAVVTESDEDTFVVSFDTDIDLWNISAQCFLRAIVLVVEEADFAVLYDGSYFSVLAGAEDLLEVVLDKPLHTARKDFREYVGSLDHEGTGFTKWLLEEEQRYSRVERS